MAETGAVQRPLTAVWRGANLPYFGKRGTIMAYSPQELKRRAVQAFPEKAKIQNRETALVLGLFFNHPNDIVRGQVFYTFFRGNFSQVIISGSPVSF